MDLDDALDFVRDHHHAVMLTFRDDGSPQLSPVLVAVADDGAVIVSTRGATAKVTNVGRDPRVSLCVLSDDFFGPWVRIDGDAEIVPLPAAMEELVDYYRRVAGEHPDWDEYRQAMQDEGRVLARITVSEVGP